MEDCVNSCVFYKYVMSVSLHDSLLVFGRMGVIRTLYPVGGINDKSNTHCLCCYVKALKITAGT